jgi:hypothetical protein
MPMAGKQDVVNLVNRKITRYVQANAALPRPVVLADPCKGFDVSGDLAADGVHPNAAGARKMASAFAGATCSAAVNAKRKNLRRSRMIINKKKGFKTVYEIHNGRLTPPHLLSVTGRRKHRGGGR